MSMQKHCLKSPAEHYFSIPRFPRLRVIFGSQATKPIVPKGFALDATLHFMLSGHVVFAEQKSLVPAWATEILAQLGEKLAFVEPGKSTKGNLLSTNL